jgi:predicted nucleotidyltransferase
VDIQTASFIAEQIRASIGPRVERILLFGSRAKGVAKPHSDFDMLLVLKERDHAVIDRIYEVTYDFELEHGIDVSLKIYSAEAVRRQHAIGTPFIRNVLQTGVEL